MAAGPEPKDDDWMTTEVQWRKTATVVVMAKAMLKKKKGVTLIKTRLLRKGQSSGSDTMLEILEDCIVFLNEKIYISALYRRHKCVVQAKCSTSTSVLYK